MIIDLSHIDGMVLFGSIVITVATYCLFWYHGARTASRWTNREWQESAIARDVARYHPKTGKWEWTVAAPPDPNRVTAAEL